MCHMESGESVEPMTVTQLLSRVDGVRCRGAGRWTARCPAHDDRSPSLSVREGDRGILLKCWAGCSLHEITDALGVTIPNLFFDAPLTNRQCATPQPPKTDRVGLAFRFELAALDRKLRAERVLTATRN